MIKKYEVKHLLTCHIQAPPSQDGKDTNTSHNKVVIKVNYYMYPGIMCGPDNAKKESRLSGY